MFSRDNSVGPIKKVENVFQGQGSAIPIGTTKYSNAHTEIGFFVDEGNIIMNAYFDPSASPRAQGKTLPDTAFVQIGLLTFNNASAKPAMHIVNNKLRELANPIPGFQNTTLYIDCWNYQAEPKTPIPVTFANWRLAETTRYRLSNLYKYPQSYGSFVNIPAVAQVRPKGQYKKVFMQKKINLDPTDLIGDYSRAEFFKTFDFSEFEFQSNFGNGIDPQTATIAGVIERLLDIQALPPVAAEVHIQNSLEFIDANHFRAFAVDYENPIAGPRNGTEKRTLFLIWNQESSQFEYTKLEAFDLEDDYASLVLSKKAPDLDRINQALRDNDLFQFRNEGVFELGYRFLVAPCSFVPIKLHEVTIGYNVILLEGFSYRTIRDWTPFGGWEVPSFSVPEEFEPYDQSTRSRFFRRLITVQLKAAYGDNFLVKFR